MAYVVINLTAFTQFPIVKNEKGEKTEIRLFPKKRATLADGYTVDNNWLARNPRTINVVKIEEPKPASTPAVVAAVATVAAPEVKALPTTTATTNTNNIGAGDTTEEA